MAGGKLMQRATNRASRDQTFWNLFSGHGNREVSCGHGDGELRLHQCDKIVIQKDGRHFPALGLISLWGSTDEDLSPLPKLRVIQNVFKSKHQV